jgi:hypothetical protein
VTQVAATLGKRAENWTADRAGRMVRAGKESVMDLTGDQGEKRRRHRRSRVQLAARIKFERSEVAAVAENISPGGAFLRVQLPDGAEWVVAEIVLPEGKTVSVKAHVRWRREDPPGVGVEFHSFLERWA